MIIDIRSEASYLKGHIEGAIHIPFTELLQNPAHYLEKEKDYQIYCEHGNKSKFLVDNLKRQGYKCVNIEGGYHNYLLRK